VIQRLQSLYVKQIVTQFEEKFNYRNRHEIPRIKKIVINRGLGQSGQNSKLFEASLSEICAITGQRGIVTRSKKPISAFKVRENMAVGISCTLRGEQMYGFLDRLINLALPRLRDFRGVNKKSFDGHGNYSLGFQEQLMFPEIDYDKIQETQGMDISIITTAKNDQEAYNLLKAFGMPFTS